MKIVIFPNDPIQSYLDKGEIKERYFNPKNMFDEVHVISLFDNDVKEEYVKLVAGSAKLKIHLIGKTNILNIHRKIPKIRQLISSIQPDIIRAYNPLLQGYCATKIGKSLGIPTILSLHANYDKDLRYYAWKNRNYKSFIKLFYSRYVLESFSLKNADSVIIIYEFIRSYAESLGAKDIHLIYNRVDLSQFNPNVIPEMKFDVPVILCVGRLIKEKNQECLIRAIRDLNVKLLLIGDGKEYNYLVNLVKQLNIEDKIIFKQSIPHSKIPNYYASCDIFALPIKYGGFAIPALEAAASGKPVILGTENENYDPITKKFAIIIGNDPKSFEQSIDMILKNKNMRQNLINSGLKTASEISGDKMENQERDLYLLKCRNNSLRGITIPK